MVEEGSSLSLQPRIYAAEGHSSTPCLSGSSFGSAMEVEEGSELIASTDDLSRFSPRVRLAAIVKALIKERPIILLTYPSLFAFVAWID